MIGLNGSGGIITGIVAAGSGIMAAVVHLLGPRPEWGWPWRNSKALVATRPVLELHSIDGTCHVTFWVDRSGWISCNGSKPPDNRDCLHNMHHAPRLRAGVPVTFTGLFVLIANTSA